MTYPIKTHQDCPHCGHKGCFSVWADGGYYCHSCETKPEGFKHKVAELPAAPGTYADKMIPYRGLNIKSVEKYGIHTSHDSKGKEIRRVYQYPHMQKYRYLPKDFSRNSGFLADHLFGMDKFNSGSSNRITIVEGEDDCPAAWEMLGGKEFVVGLPSGTVATKLLKNCHKYLDGFEQIIVATDSDTKGDNAAGKIAAAFPNKVYRVNLTKYNDAMEYYENGEKPSFKVAWNNRVKFVPKFDTSTTNAFLDLLKEEDDAYLPTGIEGFDEEHLGLFQGHVTLFQAPEGTGKTELFHYLEHYFIKQYPDVPFAACHLEESKKRTALGWVSYDLNKNVTRDDLITDYKEVEESIKRLTVNENAHLFSIGTDEDPMVLIDRVRYYINVCGCKYIFIEPIQDLAQQKTGPETDERFLARIAVLLARIASEEGVGIVLIGHENDEGLISDCRKLSKQASVVVRMERDMESTDTEMRNTTTLRSKKNRPSSFTGYAGQLLFDPTRFVLEEK